MSRGERKAMMRRESRSELDAAMQGSVDQPVVLSSTAPKGESPENLALMRRIDVLFLKYPCLWQPPDGRQLRRDGVCVGRHRVRRLMRLMGAGSHLSGGREPARRTRRIGFTLIRAQGD